MEKVMKKLTDSVVDKISMDFLRNQVLKNAYGNDDTGHCHAGPQDTPGMVCDFLPWRLGLSMTWYSCWAVFSWWQ